MNSERNDNPEILIILNFGHPLARDAKQHLYETYKGRSLVEKRVFVHLDFTKKLEPQITCLVDEVASLLSNGSPFVVVLPGLPIACALILAEIRGRTGYLPRVLHLLRDREEQKYKIRSMIDLETVREEARSRRFMMYQGEVNVE